MDRRRSHCRSKKVEPYKWQLHAMRETFQRVNDEFGITLTEVFDKKDSDIAIKLTDVPNRYAVNGSWAPEEWDPLWINKVHIIMTKDEWGQEDWAKAEWRKVFIHEIGHLLGLEHPWDKPDGDWAVKNAKIKTIHTIMGYDQEDPTGKVMDWFQKIDKRALRKIWGPSKSQNKSGSIAEVGNAISVDIGEKSFVVESIKINLPDMIIGDNKYATGTDGDDIIVDGRGKNQLIGGNGADQFYFSGEEAF